MFFIGHNLYCNRIFYVDGLISDGILGNSVKEHKLLTTLKQVDCDEIRLYEIDSNHELFAGTYLYQVEKLNNYRQKLIDFIIRAKEEYDFQSVGITISERFILEKSIFDLIETINSERKLIDAVVTEIEFWTDFDKEKWFKYKNSIKELGKWKLISGVSLESYIFATHEIPIGCWKYVLAKSEIERVFLSLYQSELELHNSKLKKIQAIIKVKKDLNSKTDICPLFSIENQFLQHAFSGNENITKGFNLIENQFSKSLEMKQINENELDKKVYYSSKDLQSLENEKGKLYHVYGRVKQINPKTKVIVEFADKKKKVLSIDQNGVFFFTLRQEQIASTMVRVKAFNFWFAKRIDDLVEYVSDKDIDVGLIDFSE
jgi:hypothetical protein